MDDKPLIAGRNSTWRSTLVKLAVVVAAIFLANFGASKIIDALEIQIWPSHVEIIDRAVLVSVILYVVLMATPFLPGIEIGLALMVMLGPEGVIITYIATLLALTLSFALGRVFAAHLLVSLLHWLYLRRAAALLERFNATEPARRLKFLAEYTHGRSMSVLLNHRYLLLALLLNLPGNVLIGGGGGIAMMAGMSRLYSFPRYLALISVAILPGPVLVMLSKYIQ
ncbi:MAG TPA: hypothetical protein VLC73_00920 [Burkholderiales bacterium]|nr:hypothetical protein [Burkholderiales bacterium]